MNSNSALLDKDFLQKLDQYHHKILYAKIISLNIDEDPIAEITGNVVSGNINVDGSSVVRRTCTLNIVTNIVRINEVDWALRTKFKVLIGINNVIDPKYDDIIWMQQGTFVITSFSSTFNGQGYTINISGKDKMSLLNGDVSGQLTAAHEFSTIYTTHNDGTISKTKIPIYTIIREAVHTYAQEPYTNIFINDLDSCGVELIDYIGDNAKMYIFEQRRENSMDGFTAQICFEGSFMGQLIEAEIEARNDLTQDFTFYYGGYEYHLLKRIDPITDISTTAGYRATDLIYPDELVVEIGGNITQMLDNIVKMLGEFEYYYDINGRFIFQRKKIYYNSSWNNAITYENQTYYDSVANSSANVYNFMSGYLVESFQNKPKLEAIRNDYSVWGKRTSTSGQEYPIHLRQAFDVRPRIYYSLTEKAMFMANTENIEVLAGYEKDNNNNYLVNEDGSYRPIYKTITGPYDWRELIYQMAKDNIQAETKIRALNLALSINYHFFHYDFQKIDNEKKNNSEFDYRSLYKYDIQKNKFIPLTIQNKAGLEPEQYEQFPGEADYLMCKHNNIYLFGPNKKLAYWSLTNENITQLENDMREGYYYTKEMDSYIKEQDATLKMPGYQYGINNKQIFTDALNSYIASLTEEQLRNKADFIAQEQQKIESIEEREQNLIDAYQENNVIEDMLFEIDQWSKTYKTGYDAYYTDMLQFWPQLYRTSNVLDYLYDEAGNIVLDNEGNPKLNPSYIEQDEWLKWCNNGQWNPLLIYYDPYTKDITFKNPELLNFWIEFFEQDEEPSLWQYSVSVIGRRSKSINDDKVKAIYFRDTPNILFMSEDWDEVKGQDLLGYAQTTSSARINLAPPISNYFHISAQGKSAKEVIDDLIYEGTYCQEQVTLNVIPIYYLEPNTRILVQDDATGINGEYLIKSFSLPLDGNSSMSIQASRVVDRIN